MGIEAIGPKPGSSLRNREHKDYPYQLNPAWQRGSHPGGSMYVTQTAPADHSETVSRLASAGADQFERQAALCAEPIVMVY